MTSRHKEHVKQLKSADPLQVQLMGVLDWILKNARLLIYTAVPVLLIVSGIFVWRYVEGQQRQQRVAALGDIQISYEEELRRAENERQAILKKIDALETPTETPAETPASGTPSQPAGDVAAQKAALQKELEAVKADHSGSGARFQEFHKQHAATPEGWMAGVTAARILIEDRKLAEARPLLEAVLASSRNSPFYQVQARLALISVLEETGDLDKALAETQELEKFADSSLLPKVLLIRGRLQMNKDAKEEARATFADLIEKHGATPEAQKARSIRALLN